MSLRGADMPGMNVSTGTACSDLAHLRQSIADILTTPLGTRLERRTYGSLLPDLIDHPDHDSTRVRLFAAVAGALMRWEPRLALRQLNLSRDPQAPGQATLTIDGDYLSSAAAPRKALQLTADLGGPRA